MPATPSRSTARPVAILMTVPNRAVARRLARLGLEARLCACANLVPGLESHYWWQGRIERARELLLIFKTTRRCVPRLQRVLLEAHPYDTPAFVVLPIVAGSRRYLDWIAASVVPAAAKPAAPDARS